MSRYFVGIDLGTTNTVVYYTDREADSSPVNFQITQTTELGEIEKLPAIPSFVYIPDASESGDGNLSLPWSENPTISVGTFASKNAAAMPMKVVSSSKSWLCSENVDRLSPILPWGRNDSDRQLSPVAAAEQIINHIRNAWNHEFGAEFALEKQQIILTVPASFDAVARELTMKAAAKAGLSPILLEEPLAAFYSWLDKNSDNWREEIEPGDVVLVCDIGGGTTDFSLIKALETEGNLELERIAVGRHILLGGDNIDLALAYTAAGKFKSEHGVNLDQQQIAGLTHLCRQAKEEFFSNQEISSRNLTVLGIGSGVIGGSLSVELTRPEVEQIVLEGFLPQCEIGEELKQRSASGLRSFGLDYEADPAITKHLSDFILTNAETGMPTCILFNGGVTKSPLIRQRIMNTIDGWLEEDSPKLRVLSDSNADMAVAHGGCAYASVKEGKGIRVKSGSAQSYYIGIESSMPAIPGFEPPMEGLCVVPFGLEEGSSIDIPYQGLGLVVGAPSEFRFIASPSRHEDQSGAILPDVADHSEIVELSPIKAELPADDEIAPGSLLPVILQGELTEVGTLQIWCIKADDHSKKWKLEFDLRNHQ